MNNNAPKSMEELEKIIQNLENKVKKLTSIIETVISEDVEKIGIALSEYKESTKKETVEVSEIQSKEHEKTFLFLKIIIESMPFPVFIKDENGKYIFINELEAKLFGLKESEVIGKDDSHFLKDADELKLVKETDKEVLVSKKGVELPDQNFSLPNGTTFVFKTHKMPFVNPISGKPNILGFSIDVSDTVNLNHLKKIMVMTSNPYI
ncbi:MAG: PAS domain S-box protein [Cytophagales bacterium]|nr:PAS domain S-box protein [Cytophaga sp.]